MDIQVSGQIICLNHDPNDENEQRKFVLHTLKYDIYGRDFPDLLRTHPNEVTNENLIPRW